MRERSMAPGSRKHVVVEGKTRARAFEVKSLAVVVAHLPQHITTRK